MNKFDKVRLQKKSDKEQADLFADSMDMIARERAILKLYDGNDTIQVHNLPHAVSLINKQLEHEYDNMMKNTTNEELHILHDGIKVLIYSWQHSNEIDAEVKKSLHHPENSTDYQEYIKHLVRLSRLETIVKILGNFKD